MARVRSLALAAVLLLAIGCTTTGSTVVAPSQTTALSEADPARWFVDGLRGQPVAGHPAGLFFEYVPASDEAGSRLRSEGHPSVRSRIPITARCFDCTAPSAESVAIRDEHVGPGSVAHLGATAGFYASLTFPAAGTWRLDPFGTNIAVRDLSSFEPPLIHVTPWSDPLPEGCGRQDVANLLKRFERAYNSGDAQLLADVVQQAVDFSIAGGEIPFLAQGREQFVRGALERHARGERIEVTAAHVASDRGGVGMEVLAIRTAPDLSQGRQRLMGKGAMWCTQPQFIHLNLGVVRSG